MGQKQMASWVKSLEYHQCINIQSIMMKKQFAVKNKNNQAVGEDASRFQGIDRSM